MEASCVIPAFENVDLVGRCVLSALSQEGVDLEVIVTDDSASAAVRELVLALAAWSPRLRYIEGPRSGNPVDNWNHGLDLALARTCVVAHQDEFFIDNRYLRRALDLMERSGAAAAIGPTLVLEAQRRSRFRLAGAIARYLGRPSWALPSLNWVGPTAAFVFRRGPKFDRDLVQLVDVEFYRRVLAGGPAPILKGACVASLGCHGASITARIDPARAALADLRRMRRQGIEHDAHRLLWGLRAWAS